MCTWVQAASSIAEYEALSNLLQQAWTQAPHALVMPHIHFSLRCIIPVSQGPPSACYFSCAHKRGRQPGQAVQHACISTPRRAGKLRVLDVDKTVAPCSLGFFAFSACVTERWLAMRRLQKLSWKPIFLVFKMLAAKC